MYWLPSLPCLQSADLPAEHGRLHEELERAQKALSKAARPWNLVRFGLLTAAGISSKCMSLQPSWLSCTSRPLTCVQSAACCKRPSARPWKATQVCLTAANPVHGQSSSFCHSHLQSIARDKCKGLQCRLPDAFVPFGWEQCCMLKNVKVNSSSVEVQLQRCCSLS